MKARNLKRGKGNKGKNPSLANKRNKRTTIDTTKADKISHGITDIEDTPDTSVWSRHIAEGHVPERISAVQGPIITQVKSANKRRNITKGTTRRRRLEDEEGRTPTKFCRPGRF
jgi:hypothetical protein